MIELKDHVARRLGPIAKPDDVIINRRPAKTRRKDHAAPAAHIAEGKALGDTTTLADRKSWRS